MKKTPVNRRRLLIGTPSPRGDELDDAALIGGSRGVGGGGVQGCAIGEAVEGEEEELGATPWAVVQSPRTRAQNLERHGVKVAAMSRSREIFPDVDPRLAPAGPGHPPGLYCLQECTGNIVPKEVMGDLQAAAKELQSLDMQGLLAGRVSAAWGALQFNPDVMVSILHRSLIFRTGSGFMFG